MRLCRLPAASNRWLPQRARTAGLSEAGSRSSTHRARTTRPSPKGSTPRPTKNRPRSDAKRRHRRPCLGCLGSRTNHSGSRRSHRSRASRPHRGHLHDPPSRDPCQNGSSVGTILGTQRKKASRRTANALRHRAPQAYARGSRRDHPRRRRLRTGFSASSSGAYFAPVLATCSEFFNAQCPAAATAKPPAMPKPKGSHQGVFEKKIDAWLIGSLYHRRQRICSGSYTVS